MVLVSNEEANRKFFFFFFEILVLFRKPPPPLKFSLDFLWSVCMGRLCENRA